MNPPKPNSSTKTADSGVSLAASQLPTDEVAATKTEMLGKLELVEARVAATKIVKTSKISSVFFNNRNEQIGSSTTLSERRPEDVIGVLPFDTTDDKLHVVVTKLFRPALLARQSVGLPLLGNSSMSLQAGETGAYLNNSDGIESSALKTLQQKCPVATSDSVRFIGTIYHPNAGVSAELAVPTAVEVVPAYEQDTLLSVPGFVADDQVISMSVLAKRESAQTLLDQFFAGTLVDPRLVEDIGQLHSELVSEGRKIEPLIAPQALKLKVNQALQSIVVPDRSISIELPILQSESAVQSYLAHTPKNPKIVARAIVNETAIDDANADKLGPYQPMQLKVRYSPGSGEAPKEFKAEAVVRATDMLVVLVLTKVKVPDGHGGFSTKTVMVTNRGARPALELRNQTPHVLDTLTTARHIEGVTGSITVAGDDRDGLKECARQIVRAKTGHEVIGEPILTDIQGYWSQGFNSTGCRFAIVSIQLDESSTEKFSPNTLLIPPDVVLAPSTSHDLPSRMAARVATWTDDSQEISDSSTSPETKQGFGKVILSESHLWKFIRESSPRLRDLLEQHPILANIITRRANDGGLRFVNAEHGDPEQFFFNSLMQNFAIHKDDKPLRVMQLLWHDFWHYEHPDPLPFRNVDSTLNPISFVEYRDAVMRNEINALLFSDVIVPEIFGIDEFEKEAGEGSLAGLLERCGYTEIGKKRAALEQALTTGELPRSIISFLKVSDNFEKYESVIREKLLGYYVRDMQQNTELLYKAWIEMPSVAQAALKMIEYSYDNHKVETFSQALDRLVSDDNGAICRSGRNPLREALGDLRTYGVYEPALRLQFIRGLLAKEPTSASEEIAKKIDRTIEELTSSYHELRTASEGVFGIERSLTNLQAYETLHKIQEGVAAKAKALIETIEGEQGCLSPASKAILKSRKHLPFPILSFDPREDELAQVQVTALLRDVGL